MCPWYKAGFISCHVEILCTNLYWLGKESTCMLEVILICKTWNLFFLQRSYATPTKLVDPVLGTRLYITTKLSSSLEISLSCKACCVLDNNDSNKTPQLITWKILTTLWRELITHPIAGFYPSDLISVSQIQ